MRRENEGMNISNADAVAALRSLLRISESRATALVERIDTLDSQGQTTLANQGDGGLSTKEVDAFVGQVQNFGGAGFTSQEQRAARALGTLAHTVDQPTAQLQEAAWKWMAARPSNPMPASVKVADLPTKWDMISPEGRYIRTLNLQELGKRIAGGKSSLSLADLGNAVQFLADSERYGAKHIADAFFFNAVSPQVKTHEFTAPSGRMLELYERAYVKGDLDVITLSGHTPQPGTSRVKYAVLAAAELSLTVAKGQVVLDASGKVYAPDSSGKVTIPVAEAERGRSDFALTIVQKGSTPKVVESLRVSLPEADLGHTIPWY